MKLGSLVSLLRNPEVCKAIVVRWEILDLVSGASDLDVYQYCVNYGITLYRHPRIHLKAYNNDYRQCFLSTANLSSRGINIPEHSFYNFEAATLIENLELSDRWYFEKIINESTIVSENQYLKLKEIVKEFSYTRQDLPALPNIANDKNFLISSLPMTFNIKTLLRISETGTHVNETELNCTIHDLVLYDIPVGLPPSETLQRLKSAFFNHPFVRAFLENLDENGQIFFGSAKAWIQKNCADVPTPRRWEITSNIQTLYRWIVDLSDGKYQVDKPNISERLFIVR